MQRRHWIVGWLIALVLVIAMAGCSGPSPEAETVDPTATTAAPTVDAPTLTPVVPETEVSPGGADIPEVTDYEDVEIPDAGVQVEVPAEWERQAPTWVWRPEGVVGETEVGVTWTELEGPQEPEAAMLPENAQTLESEPVETNLGSGRVFLMEVYEPAPADGSQAAVASVELHVLVVTMQEGRRIAYDLYAAAPTQEALAGVVPVFDRLLTSVTLLGAGEVEPPPLTTAPMPPTGSGEAPQATTDKARAILARHLDLPEDEIELVSAEYVEWPDGCLGVQLPDRACTTVIVPGYRFIFEANGSEHEVRTDKEANSVTVVPPFMPN